MWLLYRNESPHPHAALLYGYTIIVHTVQYMSKIIWYSSTMKTVPRRLSTKKVTFKSRLTSKVKSTIVGRYKKCRIWLAQGWRRIAGWRESAAADSRSGIDDIFRRLDDDRDADHSLYPNCDTSVWLRNCTREIHSPIWGAVSGQYIQV